MNIHSKQLLYAPTSTTPPAPTEYEVYYFLKGNTVSFGTITDLSRTKAVSDDSYLSKLCLFNGFVYHTVEPGSGNPYMQKYEPTTSGGYYDSDNVIAIAGQEIRTDSQGIGSCILLERNGTLRYIDNSSFKQGGSIGYEDPTLYTNWTQVSGYYNYSSKNDPFYVSTDGIYQGANPGRWLSKISDVSNWEKITGYQNSNSSTPFGYGIAGGKLYYIYTTANGGITQQGSDETWTDVSGGYISSTQYGFGINAGKLYALSTTQTQVGTDTTWTKISGYSKKGSGFLNQPAYALGINNGALYGINATTATQIGSSTDWKGCSGCYSSTTQRALAYDSSALYYITTSGATKIMDGEFVYCGGCYQSSSATAVGVAIRKKQTT